MSIKNRYTWERRVVIALPLLFSLASVVNTLLGYFEYNTNILDYLCGISAGSIVMLYLMHSMFGLCRKHRIMIDYLSTSTALSFADMYFGIPCDDDDMLIIYLSVFGVFSIIYFLTALKE